MKLSELKKTFGLNLYRDGFFSSLGKANHTKHELLIFLESSDHLHSIEANKEITAVITKPELSKQIPCHLGVCVSETPRALFYDLHDHLLKKSDFYGVLKKTSIHESASVHPTAVIPSDGVVIEKGVIVEAGAIIHTRTRICASAIIRSGAIIGAEGFEFFRDGGNVRPVSHAGGVILKSNSEIQSGAVVEKAVYGGNTIIGSNTKIGSKTLVAHNSIIGTSCLLAGGVTVSGNVILGDSVWVGPGATISNSITLGDKSHIAIGSVVVRSINKNKSVSPIFAADKHSVMKFMAKSRLIT